MSSLYGRRGFSTLPSFFIKVDKVGLSMYNRGLEVLPMEVVVFFIIAAGIFCGVMEQSLSLIHI